MDPAVAIDGGPLSQAGVIAAAALAAAAVLVRSSRLRALAMAGALVLTPALLVAHIWDAPQFAPFRWSPLIALGAAVAGIGLLAGAAVLIDRRPAVLPVAALVALPFRVPIEAGGASANLLVPLYFVVGAGALAFVVPRLRGAERDEGPRAGALEWLLVGLVVLYALQSLYSENFGKALEQVVFFYVPFALLFALLVRVEWTPRLLRTCFGVLLGLAVVFCLIGFVEYQQRELLLNPQVIASNQFQSYFRVNSLFFDPNIFGRFLVMVMLATTAAMLWAGRARGVLLAGVALAVLWGGLVLTLSQSSLAALLVGLAVLAGLRWSARWTAAVALAALALGAAGVAAFPQALRLKLDSQESIESATSGRGKLIAGGWRLFVARPVAGWGSGAFEPVYRRRERVSGERAITASHTIPLTVAAEQGAIGALVYLALLAVALARLLRGARGSPARAAIAAAFAALVVHTWLYAAFLEDPLAWALLAIGTALAPRVRREPERHPAEQLREPAAEPAT
jgi:O-antigen ligase